MNLFSIRRTATFCALFAVATFVQEARATSVVVLDVPQLATAGSARAFEFVNFQFNLYLVAVGTPDTEESDPTFSANVLANDKENYTYEHAASTGSGRGGGYHPPRYVRGPANTYAATYQNVTSQPQMLDAFFHFSGADVAGIPLAMSVLTTDDYLLRLTADDDPTHSPISPGSPLASGLYTLEFQTASLLGSQVTINVAAPGDANGDNIVDFSDLNILLTNYAQAGSFATGDFDGSGTVDFSDLNILLSGYTQAAPVSAMAVAVPEPGGLLLAAASAMTLLLAGWRRR